MKTKSRSPRPNAAKQHNPKNKRLHPFSKCLNPRPEDLTPLTENCTPTPNGAPLSQNPNRRTGGFRPLPTIYGESCFREGKTAVHKGCEVPRVKKKLLGSLLSDLEVSDGERNNPPTIQEETESYCSTWTATSPRGQMRFIQECWESWWR